MCILNIELYQTFFNILYEENINCRLVTTNTDEARALNWNRINAQICFNYLQQEFYLVNSTMKTLAQGKKETAILKLLRITLNVSQSNFGDLELDDECIRDIADVVTAEAEGGVVGSAAMKNTREEHIALQNIMNELVDQSDN